MTEIVSNNPAELASIACIQKVYQAIDAKKNFLVEAGAGAGKTYTLIRALKYLIQKHSGEYQKTNKRIACITYTNVAKDEIRSRTDNHPIILADTIHAFAWEVIQGFQKTLRGHIPNLGEKWQARIDEIGGINNQRVIYSLGYPKATAEEIFLHHDDVIKLFTILLNDEKFKKNFSSKFPVVLIDEYQDTNKDLATALVDNFIEPEFGSLIGFFGDHWQKIYGSDSCGLISASAGKLESIGKQANFRSDKNIVELLNRLRPELLQFECNPDSTGEIKVFHTNNWVGTRREGQHWKGDLPENVAHDFLEWVKSKLDNEGWNISPENTKVLMLTNNVLAAEQGYQSVFKIFSDTDDYLKKNDDYISFLLDTVEVGAEAFEKGKYGAMIEAFRINTPRIRKHADKKSWQEDMNELITCRNSGTVGDVIDLLKKTHKPKLSKKIDEKEKRLKQILEQAENDRTEEDKNFASKIQSIRSIPYEEIKNVNNYIDDKTLYSTKHGVKGAQFENVIVVLGRGWNHYNWEQFLEWHHGGIPAGKKDSYERNRNLFYVACSRPQKRLCLLFTQLLSPVAMEGLHNLFGNVIQEAILD